MAVRFGLVPTDARDGEGNRRMTRAIRWIGAHLRPVLFTIVGLIVCMIGFFLWMTYRSQIVYRQFARMTLQYDAERIASALEYFYTVRLDDIQNAVESRELGA